MDQKSAVLIAEAITDLANAVRELAAAYAGENTGDFEASEGVQSFESLDDA